MTWQPMSHAIDTERLTLRLRDERDAAWYRELVAERGDEMPTLEEATARLARFRDLTIEIGIGALAIRRRAEGDAIGYCALVVGRCSLDEPEIAYELLRRFHGRGYATEASQALVDAAAGPTPALVDRAALERGVPPGAREDRVPQGPHHRG